MLQVVQAFSTFVGFIIVLFVLIACCSCCCRRRQRVVKEVHYVERAPEAPRVIETQRVIEKVLVVCRFCGAKNEQGLTKCKTCGADL
jgi:hypothetical protein